MTGVESSGPVRDEPDFKKHFAMPATTEEKGSGDLVSLTILKNENVRRDRDPIEIEKVRGAEALKQLRESVYRLRYANAIMGRQKLYTALGQLIAADGVTEDNFASLSGSISSNRSGFDAITGLPSSDMTDDEIDLLRPACYRENAKHLAQRLFVKVHDGYHADGASGPIFPADCTSGAIYLVRHPFDVAVSYASHQGHEKFDKIVKQLNNPDHVMAGGGKNQLRQRTLGWRGHYLSWHRQGAIPVLTVRYEDMLADTAACLKRMASFLGLPEQHDEAAIAQAVEERAFDKLRAKEDRSGFRERPEKTERFFRAGRAGDGWTVLNDEQREALYTANRDVMEELNYTPLAAKGTTSVTIENESKITKTDDCV